MPQAVTSTTIRDALAETATQKGAKLAALSEERPLLLVFLRHFG
jgi:hypothetical protein